MYQKTFMQKHTRIERDFLGEREIPDEYYFGIQTLRGIENFDISRLTLESFPSLIKSLGYVKKAAALTNKDLGVLKPEIADAIVQACDSVIAGELNDQFRVDMIQGGAGTSTNMNANEVIANKALEILGHPKGKYEIVHPNNHVNCSQSTNDVYPTALRIALYMRIGHALEEMELLQLEFSAKGREFKDVLKMGRTQLQDAVPMTLGQEFTAYSVTVQEDIKRLSEARALVTEVNLGGTAIGTMINSPEGYRERATEYLKQVTGLPLVTSLDLVEATWDTGAYVQLSGVMKRIAVKLSKICNDLRLLSSGPRAGLNEINLPQMQPGSSIMPGKVNPVIPEVVNQVAFQIIGSDVTVTMAAEAGQLQLNVMEPVIAYNLIYSLGLLSRACKVLREKCVSGITANVSTCRDMVFNSIGIVTALNPILGYDVCSSIAKESLNTGESVFNIVLTRGLLSEEKLKEIFSPENLMNPKFISE